MIRPPAPAGRIAEVAAAIGRPVPLDLDQWWQQADGMERGARGCLIPWGFVPMSCRDTLEVRASWLNSSAALDDEGDDELSVADDADLYGFHPLFLPIGDDLCGNFLCIDMRNGPRNGHLGRFDHEAGWYGADFLYRGVTHMLLEIRNALIDGAPVSAGARGRVARSYRAVVTPSRELEWVDAG